MEAALYPQQHTTAALVWVGPNIGTSSGRSEIEYTGGVALSGGGVSVLSNVGVRDPVLRLLHGSCYLRKHVGQVLVHGQSRSGS